MPKKEATLGDIFTAFGRTLRRPKAKCMRCGTEGYWQQVFKAKEVGLKARSNAAIPVIAGKTKVTAWGCKHCPED